MKSSRCQPLVVVFFLFFCCSSVCAVPLEGASNPAQSDSAQAPATTVAASPSSFTIPGPLRSFLRMAGMSQAISPEEVMPFLSRQVFMRGYDGSRATEFLILLRRYVEQSRELTLLAGPDATIRISNCDDVKPLLRILGYQVRPTCGQPGATLRTADSERAFLTIDSGFPLPELEKTLQGGAPFVYPYSPTTVPVLFAASDWSMASRNNHVESSRDLLDTLLRDSDLARLYWALSRMDPDTASFLQHARGIHKLLPYGRSLDFYGSHIYIRDGRVVVPGGSKAEAAWEGLAQASPASPADFIPRLLLKDKGWLAAYFDVLSRASADRQEYFTGNGRLGHFYSSLRAPVSNWTATTGSYRPAPGLLLLVTRLQLTPDGEPEVPGNIEVWNDIVRLRRRAPRVYQPGCSNAPEILRPRTISSRRCSCCRAHKTKPDRSISIWLSANSTPRDRQSIAWRRKRSAN